MRSVFRMDPAAARAMMLLLAGTVLALPIAARGDFIWDGGGPDDLWTTDANWAPDGAPPFDLGDQAFIFGATGADQSPDADAGEYFNISGLAFTGADSALTLIGTGSLSFNDGAAITNDSAQLQIINIDLIGSGDELVLDAQAGDLEIGGDIDLPEEGGLRLRVLGDFDTTIEGRILGIDSRLFKEGDGTLTLRGNNTYADVTRLLGGTIILGNDNALGRSQLNVLDDGVIQSGSDTRVIDNDVEIDDTKTLTVSGAKNLRMDGEISGDGAMEFNADEDDVRFHLTGENSYAGGTTFTKGTLILGDDEALGTGDLTLAGDGTVESDSDNREIDNDIDTGGNRLTVDGDFDLTLNGIISGAGGLTLDTDVVLTLTGESTYAGLTEINEGELVLDGSVGGAVDINEDATLSGEGSMGGDLTAADGATISPGNSIGTFEVGGNYDQQSGSTLVVELDGDEGRADLLDVAGTATLASGSTIEASITGRNYIPSDSLFTVLEADGGITDEGATVETISATLTVDLVRDEEFDDADTRYRIQVLRAADAYSRAARPGNNRRLGTALDSFVPVADDRPAGEAAKLLAKLDRFDRADYNAALLQLSPESYNASAMIGIHNAQVFNASQSAYLAAKRAGIDMGTLSRYSASARGLDPQETSVLLSAFADDEEDGEDGPRDRFGFQRRAMEKRWGSYARIYKADIEQDTNAKRTGFDADTVDFQAGIDYRFARNITAGLALGYATTQAGLANAQGDIDADAFRIGPYMSWTVDDWYFDSSVTFAWHTYDTTRDIPTVDLIANSEYDGYELTAYFATGYRFELFDRFDVSPMASVQYSYFSFDGFTENGGGGANLIVEGRDTDSLRTRLGANFSYRFDLGLRMRLVPNAFVAWEHEFMEDDAVEAAFAVGGSPFVIDTGDRDSDALISGVGAHLLFSNTSSIFFRYERYLADDSEVDGVVGGFRLLF
ncbi:MAG: autotransporter domain-containing protein [Planctomycetota bacterium]|nr:autotransporter domain-containing protein [Planctomycetota bacterium]